MKLSDFKYYHIVHRLKWFPVNSNQRRCNGNTFVKEHLAEIFRFSKEMAFFSHKSYLYLICLKFGVSTLKLTNVQNFSKIGKKITDLEF